MLEIDEPAGSGRTPVAGLALRLSLVVTPSGRRVHLTVEVAGTQARQEAEEAGPASTNWDRMRVGGVEWRMVEPLLQWDLSVEDEDEGMHAYLSFTGAGPPYRIAGGYEQLGTVTGQVQVGGRRTNVTGASARRAHIWG